MQGGGDTFLAGKFLAPYLLLAAAGLETTELPDRLHGPLTHNFGPEACEWQQQL